MNPRWQLDHPSLPAFEPDVRQLVHDFASAGREAFEREGGRMDRLKSDKKAARRFIKLCHRGYMRGQDRLIEALLETDRQRRSTIKEHDEEARREVLQVVANREAVLRSLADLLVLVLFKFETWAMRRLIHFLQPPTIQEGALRFAQEYVHRMYDQNPLCFGLVTDLTSCIGIFDVLQVDFKKSEFPIGIELKEGVVNERILEMMHGPPNEKELADFYEEHGRSGIEQIGRILRQLARAHTTVEAIQKDYGTDVLTGLTWATTSERLELDYWADALEEAIVEAKQTGFSSRLFENCLYVVCYDGSLNVSELSVALALYNQLEPQADFPLSESEDGQLIGVDVLQNRVRYLDDLRSGFYCGDCIAPWLLPAHRDAIIDVVFGRLVVKVYLDPVGLMKLAEKRGVAIRWATRKERAAYAEMKREAKPLTFPQGCLVAETDELTIYVGPGLWKRVLFDFMAPHSLLDNLLFGIDSKKENLDNASAATDSDG